MTMWSRIENKIGKNRAGFILFLAKPDPDRSNISALSDTPEVLGSFV